MKNKSNLDRLRARRSKQRTAERGSFLREDLFSKRVFIFMRKPTVAGSRRTTMHCS